VWDETTFLKYIKDPKADIPGTKMVFVGIKDETQAKNLWAYLKQFGPDGKKK
jgi:cytochrome c